MKRDGQKALIFVETKIFADTLGALINQEPYNIRCTTLHGDRIQEDRDRAVNDFKVAFYFDQCILSMYFILIIRT